MSTLLTEVEATLNSRPLTFVHNELDEPQPLTPAHFLVGERFNVCALHLCVILCITSVNSSSYQLRPEQGHPSLLSRISWRLLSSENTSSPNTCNTLTCLTHTSGALLYISPCTLSSNRLVFVTPRSPTYCNCVPLSLKDGLLLPGLLLNWCLCVVSQM